MTDLLHRVERIEAQMDKSSTKKMTYRQLGDTGLRVSTVSLGCAPLGNVYGDLTDDEAKNIVHGAFERGINTFDTSPYYGNTTSETVLGRCLKDLPRDDIIVATKVGRYGDGPDFSRERVTQSIEESLNRLQLEHIDVIQCHDVEFASSLEQVVYEALPAMHEAKLAGKVRHIGITGLPLLVLDYLLDRIDEVHPDIQVETILTYCCLSLNNSNLHQYLPRWKHRKLGIMQGGATSMGLLTAQGPPPWHPAPPQLKDVCARAVKACEEGDINIAKIAFQYTFGERGLDTTLVGATSTDHIDQYMSWMHEPAPLEVIKEVEDILAPIKNKLWVEKGSEENIALAAGGFWAAGRDESFNVIQGVSQNLGKAPHC